MQDSAGDGLEGRFRRSTVNSCYVMRGRMRFSSNTFEENEEEHHVDDAGSSCHAALFLLVGSAGGGDEPGLSMQEVQPTVSK